MSVQRWGVYVIFLRTTTITFDGTRPTKLGTVMTPVARAQVDPRQFSLPCQRLDYFSGRDSTLFGQEPRL